MTAQPRMHGASDGSSALNLPRLWAFVMDTGKQALAGLLHIMRAAVLLNHFRV